MSTFIYSLDFCPKLHAWQLNIFITLCATPWTLYSPWNSPGQNTGVGCHALLQGIFPTQGSNPGLPHCRRILYHLSHQGSPWILEWVAYPFSWGIFPTQESNPGLCIAGRFFTNWATREAFPELVLLHNFMRTNMIPNSFAFRGKASKGIILNALVYIQ